MKQQQVDRDPGHRHATAMDSGTRKPFPATGHTPGNASRTDRKLVPPL
ncbi:hypothetical protein VTH82DRAFT_12 [Thermothelomyces myriococcoides]